MANIIVAQLLYLDAVDPTKVCLVSIFLIGTSHNFLEKFGLLHVSCYTTRNIVIRNMKSIWR